MMFLFFIAAPFEWLIYFIILITGISRFFEGWSPEQKRATIWRKAMCVFLLSYSTYTLSKSYGIST